MNKVRSQPCEACPYRQDVPSGIWTKDEYDKLPPYDAPTGEQPIATFGCHAAPEFYCHGWAVVHSNRGREFELLALRFWPAAIPKPKVPLFSSGAEAAAHGIRNILKPSKRARAVMAKLMARYPRLQPRDRP